MAAGVGGAGGRVRAGMGRNDDGVQLAHERYFHLALFSFEIRDHAGQGDMILVGEAKAV